MEFYDAKILTTIAHYLISISLLLSGTFVKNTGFLSAVFRFYLCVFIWAVICYLYNGCPFTHLENELAIHYYGKEFYEEYDFNQTDVKALISYPAFYYPCIAAILLILVKFLTNRGHS